MLRGPSQLLQLLLILLTTSLPGVTAAYYMGLPNDTPIGAAIAAVLITLIGLGLLSRLYINLKNQAIRLALGAMIRYRNHIRLNSSNLACPHCRRKVRQFVAEK